jgi:hypothetical protein
MPQQSESITVAPSHAIIKTLNIVALKIEKYKMCDFFQGWGYDFIFYFSTAAAA